MKRCFDKIHSTIYLHIETKKNHFQRDSNDFRHKKMALRARFFLVFERSEEVGRSFNPKVKAFT